MMSVYLAICLSATPIQDCGRLTAVAWFKAPEAHGTPYGCFKHGMFYAAESQLVTHGSYLKVICARPQPETVPGNTG